MTNTEPRGPMYIIPPNRDGGGWSRTWQRTIAGRVYSFTAVVMPLTGDLRYFVRRLRHEYADAPQFDCGWERAHEIIVSGARPQAWRRTAPGVYTAGDIEIRRDNNAGADNRWSLRRPGYQNLAFRLLKSAKAFADRHVSRHTADTLIDQIRQAYRAQAEGCTIGDAERTMGRSRAHGGPVVEYEFKANGERALLCREHGGAYGDLARVAPARRPAPVAYTEQPQQQSAQADQPTEVHAPMSASDPAAPACGQMNPGDRTSDEPGFVTCNRCRAAAKPYAVIVPPDDYPSVTGSLVTWLLIGGEVRHTPDGWVGKLSPNVARMHPWAHSVQVIDAGLVDYAINTQAVQRHQAGNVTYLSLPPLRENTDVVTVTPRRDGRQFDVIEVAGTGVETMVRVSPRNPLHLDDGLRWVSRTYVRTVAAEDVEPYADDDQAEQADALRAILPVATSQPEQVRRWLTRHGVDPARPTNSEVRAAIDADHAEAATGLTEAADRLISQHAAATGLAFDAAEADLRARAEALDPDISGPLAVTVTLNGQDVEFTRNQYVTIGTSPGLWRIARFTTRGGVTPAMYALLTSVDDEHVKTGAYVRYLRADRPSARQPDVAARAAGRAAEAYRRLLMDYRAATQAGNTDRALALSDALRLVRENAVELAVDVEAIDRQAGAGTFADLLMPAMPEQYRSALTHLLAAYGFAAPVDIDAKIGDDANPRPFLMHDPTGLAIGVHDKHVRLSYPAVHAGEGDGDIGTAWFDLAYGTSFETVADVAVGLSQRLTPAEPAVAVYRLRAPYVGHGADGCRRSAEIDLAEADTHPTGSERWQQCRDSAEQWLQQAAAIDAQEAAVVVAEPTMGTGNVARDDAESLVFADEGPTQAEHDAEFGGDWNDDVDQAEGDVVDAGGYLACGCHGSQRDHTCPASETN